MIATKLSTVYAVEFPEEVQKLLDNLSIPFGLGLNLLTGSLECMGLGGFLQRLSFYVVAPACLFLVIILAVAVGTKKEHRPSYRALVRAT